MADFIPASDRDLIEAALEAGRVTQCPANTFALAAYAPAPWRGAISAGFKNKTAEKRRQPGRLGQKILKLADGTQSCEDIAQALGSTYRSVQVLASRLRNAGHTVLLRDRRKERHLK